MRNQARTLSRPASVLLLTLTSIGLIAWFAPEHGLRAVRAQSASASGSCGFLLNSSVIDHGDGNGGTGVGVMILDGAGNVTGKHTFQGRLGPEDRASGALTGT